MSIMVINLVKNIDDNSLFSIFVSVLTIPFIVVSSMMISNEINKQTKLYIGSSFNALPLIFGIALSGITLRIFFPQLVF